MAILDIQYFKEREQLFFSAYLFALQFVVNLQLNGKRSQHATGDG